MKRVKLITTDQHNGKEAISRTPLRNRYFFDGAWHEVELQIKKINISCDEDSNEVDMVVVKPEILRDAQIIETTEAIFAEMGDLFDIMALISHVECETPNRVHQATIQRQLCQLRQYGKLNYEVVNEQKGLYRKLPVFFDETTKAPRTISATAPQTIKIDFNPDWKKRFVKFLKEEGAYEKFMKHSANDRDDSFDEYFASRQLTDELDLLVSAFGWRFTDDGDSYWRGLNKKWSNIYNGKN